MFGIDDAALGLLAAGAVSTAGSLYANNKMLDQQIHNNNLSVDLSNTAHQREVIDLYKAGLNPILSASGQGAGVPSLGVASQQNPGEGIANGLTNASRLATEEYKANVAIAEEATTASSLNNELLRKEAHLRNLGLDAEIIKQSFYNDGLKHRLGAYTKGLPTQIKHPRHSRSEDNWQFNKMAVPAENRQRLYHSIDNEYKEGAWKFIRSWVPFMNSAVNTVNGFLPRSGKTTNFNIYR